MDDKTMRWDFSDVTDSEEAARLGRLYPIVLREHTDAWAEWFLKEKVFLVSVFGDNVIRINHIGSTAVPGLLAKPTVDILLEISDDVDLVPITETMTSAGYIVNTPEKDLIMYIKGYGSHGFDGQTAHIHVRRGGDWGEVYFRDYLIVHAEAAEEYAALKRELKEKFEHDRDEYTAAKGKFVEAYTALAREEFADRYKP